jgi:hypothetical protein
MRLLKLPASIILAVALTANATIIYRWVDEKGRTHISDVVPEKYKESATRVDSGQYEVSPEQTREAERNARKLKARAEEAEKRRVNAQASAPRSTASAASASRRPAQSATESTDCDTRWRLYRESEDCFGPYRTVGGGIKPEAFDKCKPIPSPELQCGPFKR